VRRTRHWQHMGTWRPARRSLTGQWCAAGWSGREQDACGEGAGEHGEAEARMLRLVFQGTRDVLTVDVELPETT